MIEDVVAVKDVNPFKSRLLEEAMKEDVRAIQLESLLEAFQSAVDEKEQLNKLANVILSEMRDLKMKVNDDVILMELDNAIDEKCKQIDAEQAVCSQITTVSTQLATEISNTRIKISELQKTLDNFPETEEGDNSERVQYYQTLLRQSIEVKART